MINWWRRLWCLHLWLEGDITDIVYGKGYEREYTCEKCNKKIRRFEAPVSFIEYDDIDFD